MKHSLIHVLLLLTRHDASHSRCASCVQGRQCLCVARQFHPLVQTQSTMSCAGYFRSPTGACRKQCCASARTNSCPVLYQSCGTKRSMTLMGRSTIPVTNATKSGPLLHNGINMRTTNTCIARLKTNVAALEISVHLRSASATPARGLC